jgi:uncharacterized membrane protein YuzA (DUF378 family)
MSLTELESTSPRAVRWIRSIFLAREAPGLGGRLMIALASFGAVGAFQYQVVVALAALGHATAFALAAYVTVASIADVYLAAFALQFYRDFRLRAEGHDLLAAARKISRS